MLIVEFEKNPKIAFRDLDFKDSIMIPKLIEIGG